MISIIIPVKKDDPDIDDCLMAIKTNLNIETILVLDGWEREFSNPPRNLDLSVYSVPKSGPAHCRNQGVKMSKYDIICFLDSDVLIHKNTLEKGVEYIKLENIDGVIGSYDDNPTANGIVSKFRNLLHHYHHQKNNLHIGVFWGAFSIVKKEVFEISGGFDENYKFPSVEDIELGYRIFDLGFSIQLRSDLFITHQKKWTLWNMVKTDVVRRAIPWTVLLSDHKMWNKNNLNTNNREKISALLSLFFVFSLILIPVISWMVPLVILVSFIVVQRNIYTFFKGKMELIDLMIVPFLHIIYFNSAVIGFIIGKIRYLIIESGKD